MVFMNRGIKAGQPTVDALSKVSIPVIHPCWQVVIVQCVGIKSGTVLRD